MAFISEEAKLRRRQSVESVLGTSAMEGQFPDAQTLALLRQYQEGELDQEALSAALDEHVAQMLAVRASARATIAQEAVDAA